jgi:cyclopropane fatty-acyl-phospholipid synthase-like methyltransferase
MSPQNDRFGLEINKTAAAIANKVEGLTVWNNYDEIPSKMKFDVIFSTDVIEHITTPTSFLKPLHDMLNEGGSLIITSGDAYNFYAKLFAAKWWYWYFPEHISFISKKWLTKFANEQGFIIKEIKKFYYHRTPALKRLRLLAGSLLLATMNLNNQMKLLQFIHKTKRPNRFQIGKGVSKDHIFVVLQAK